MNIYPGLHSQVTTYHTLGSSIDWLQVEMSPRKGKLPRAACGPEEAVGALRGRRSGRVLGNLASHVAL